MKKTISVEGMTCKHCVMHVKNALLDIAGVTNAEVDLSNKSAVVEGANFSDEALRLAIEDAGYSVTAIV